MDPIPNHSERFRDPADLKRAWLLAGFESGRPPDVERRSDGVPVLLDQPHVAGVEPHDAGIGHAGWLHLDCIVP